MVARTAHLCTIKITQHWTFKMTDDVHVPTLPLEQALAFWLTSMQKLKNYSEDIEILYQNLTTFTFFI